MDLSAILISLKTSSVSFVYTFFMGILCAYIVVSLRSRALKTVLDSILTLPLVLPPTVAGFLLLIIFGVNRPLGQFLLEFFGVKIVFNWQATVLAAAVISFPLMYRSARGAFEQVDKTLIQAAQTLGMGKVKILFKVMLPLAMPGLASGGILAFSRGLGEFGATAMIAGNIAKKTRTLPLAVYSAVAGGNMESAYSYAAILLAISFLSAVGINVISAKNYWGGTKAKRTQKLRNTVK